MTNPVLKAALAYAAQGWKVFPVPAGTKRSHIAGKAKTGERWGATRDAAEITRLWKKWSNAGIGLPTGGENGIWVLEVDTPKGHGVDGRAELVKLVIKNTQLPVTLTSQSPSGSTHYYFKHPGV